jgi:SecD/SecF fusion protein
MQGKGLVTLVAIVLGLICLNELLPSFYANKIEKKQELLQVTIR